MDKSLLGALQKMGSNFLVAAFVPAMGFIVTTLVAFYPILPHGIQKYLLNTITGDSLTQFVQFGFILLVFVTILGFTLYSLRIYIYKAFEGYSFILGRNTPLRRSFIRRQMRRFNRIEIERIFVEKQITRVDKKIDLVSRIAGNTAWQNRRLDRYVKRRQALDSRQYDLTSERNACFPPSINLILPTRFGNILRAAELYSGTRYSIDAVPMWGRLAHVIPEESIEKLDDANNQCLFLLNVAVLGMVFSIICFLTLLYLGLGLLGNIVIPDAMTLVGYYTALIILSSVIAWVFYEASLLNVGQYGDMIRTAYDLYRFNLLEALHFKLPSTLKAEKKLWRSISYFVAGNDNWKPLDLLEIKEKYSTSPIDNFPYHHPEKTTARVSPES